MSRALIQTKIHGFTGCSTVWQRNIPALSERWRVIAPDLRGHGESDKPKHGYHVSRLAMDLRELLVHLLRDFQKAPGDIRFRVVAGSLGCSILWLVRPTTNLYHKLTLPYSRCYAELFTTAPFTHMIFVDQAPLQNSTLDGWDTRFCNRGMNSAATLAALQTTLQLSPETAYKNTIASCLAYRSHPLPSDGISFETSLSDESFFLARALKGNPQWYGKLMADHTSLDWRDSISTTFGDPNSSETKVLVIASSRS
jgi:pimeloyl-ACP methyl ester carboxylesterase